MTEDVESETRSEYSAACSCSADIVAFRLVQTSMHHVYAQVYAHVYAHVQTHAYTQMLGHSPIPTALAPKV